MSMNVVNIGWTVLFCLVGGGVGICLMLIALAILPRLVDKLTPKIDEEKEILRGNRAVADYFSKIIAASIIGISIVVAAAVLGGIIAGLY